MTNGKQIFGSLIKQLRKEQQLGLREFCLRTGLDPSNWSKMERGIKKPPKDHRTLVFFAESLNIKEGSERWQQFLDAAASARGMLPDDFKEETFVSKLPAFFRTIREHDVTPDELDRIIRFVKRDYGLEEE